MLFLKRALSNGAGDLFLQDKAHSHQQERESTLLRGGRGKERLLNCMLICLSITPCLQTISQKRRIKPREGASMSISGLATSFIIILLKHVERKR